LNWAGLSGSLRVRLLATTLVWIAATIALAGWGLSSLFRDHVRAQFEAELVTHLDQLTAQLAADAQGRVSLSMPLSDPRFNRPYGGLYWQIDHRGPAQPGQTDTGSLRSRSLWDQVLAVPDDVPGDGELHRHQLAGPQDTRLGAVERTVRVEDMPLRLIVAADERLMQEPVARFNGALWLALGVLGAGLAVAALLQVVVGLAPLRRLRLALTRVRAGTTRRLEGRFPTEVEPLVEEFNSVLAQNAEVVDRARTQAGNLAHALKTPLSVLANAVAGREDELARLVSAQTDIARKQVEYHLTRARAAAVVRVPGMQTPVGPAVDGLVRTMQRIYAERNLVLSVVPVDARLMFNGEEHDLQEMLGNLLDNACKWAASRVSIAAEMRDGRIELRVEDDGPGIAPESRAAMFQRGVRADEQVPGTGLGLAIVDDLARLYGGDVALGGSPLGGLSACLYLPGSVSP
jgi:signal transduction histidine kinase